MRGKKLISGLFLLLVIFPFVNSLDSDLNEREELWLETTVTTPIHFVKEGPNPSLQYLKINYSWIPVDDYRQKLSSYESSPEGLLTNNILMIETNTISDFDLRVKFITHTNSNPLVVSTKVEFPLKSLDSSLSEYTVPSGKIDINEDIRKKATELAAGEDDLYVVVFNLADWVNSNIEYNLSSSNVDASLPASWVYENKQGVCDEISNLFISMCRSLGIPARFVSGIAYTDDAQFENPWGPHGWAEVYFPGYGWVPFDPTYDQLGYVDATHIRFSSNSENKDALEYVWLGRDMKITSSGLDIEGKVINEGKIVDDDFSIEINFMNDEVSFESYNVVDATIYNARDHYVSASVALSRVDGVSVIGEERQDILLMPGKIQHVYWIVKVDDLDPSYRYTFPVTVYSSNEKASSEFKSSDGKTKILLGAAQNYISRQEVSVQGPGLECISNKQTLYLGDEAEITCTTNSLRLLDLCVEDTCSKESFSSITKKFQADAVGFTTIQIVASDSLSVGSKTKSYSFLSFNILDEANISMNLVYPEKIKFDEQGEIRILLNKESSSLPKDLSTKIVNKGLSEEWVISALDHKQEYVLIFEGKNLKSGNNEVKIVLEYSDELGKKYVQEETINIELYDLTLIQKVEIWLNGLF
ncbi:MAG: transglutaminase-like domain-containing protein [Candidatus Nanoarchaeia archaeon]